MGNLLHHSTLILLRARFDQMVAAIEIHNSSGTLVYESEIGTAKDAIIWVWRELLVSAMVPDTKLALLLVKDLTADVERLGLSDELLKRLDVVQSRWCYSFTVALLV